ncbi:MAG: MotA/TolQ/ExbB proton channel family protein [Planctomycetaceae bacterium]|nr:MotA/TolQ/ExbB proton channel family protein [Planctomycetaceae bacterium]
MSTNNLSYLRLAMWIGTAGAILYILASGIGPLPVLAQQPADVAGPSSEPAPTGESAAAAPVPSPIGKSINIWSLAMAGGLFMIPIFGFSLLAGTFVIERFIGLRQSRVLPEPLVAGLGQLGGSQGTFDPRRAYKLCQENPSAAANVIRAMLLKVGRPVSEIESTVAQASQREADKLYANVRWLNISASLATMLGLIGTIQGMIMAFHQLTILAAEQDRTQVLAAGIYTALVTTFAGLCVAIPAAFFSHYFEGRIQGAFREIDELIFSLVPQLERYEGRLRFNRHAGDGEAATSDRPNSGLTSPALATPSLAAKE